MSWVTLTSDPAWDAERATWPENPVPVCCKCGREIGDDEIYEIDGDIYCEDCNREMFRISYEEWRTRNGSEN